MLDRVKENSKATKDQFSTSLDEMVQALSSNKWPKIDNKLNEDDTKYGCVGYLDLNEVNNYLLFLLKLDNNNYK